MSIISWRLTFSLANLFIEVLALRKVKVLRVLLHIINTSNNLYFNSAFLFHINID